ncbi:MAG: flagellar hook-associated protein FlgK [Steroidobacteraceae bacterium]
MASMLSTGVSGLLSMQTALDTTSHNIANSATVGYNRQGVVLAESQPQFSGGSWVGTGVNVATVRRFYDELVAGQVRMASSGKSQWEVYSSLSDQVNNLFSDSTTGLSSTLQGLANAFQNVANSPSSSSERQVLLSKAQTLVNQLQSYSSRLNQIDVQINSQLESEAGTVTQLASSIATLNTKIAAASVRGSDVPNDLLNQRDRYIDELATHVNVSTVTQTDGQVNVFIGNGQPLVLGGIASNIVAVPDKFDLTHKTLVIQSGSGAQIDISKAITGGTMGGLIEFRDQMLVPAQNNLGQIAVGMAAIMNDQQHAGLDLYGSLGADMFAVGGVGVRQSTNNAGSTTISVTRGDVQALTTNDYILTRTATGWSLQNSLTGQSVPMTGSGTSGDPFVADGLSLVVSGSAVTGDKFQIQPTRDAVAGMSLKLTDPKAIAAAAPIIASANLANTGSASITSGEVLDASNANLQTTVTIQFLSASSYTTDGGVTTNAYTAGQNIDINGWRVKITGTPDTSDQFTVGSNSGGSGDNRNALLLANALERSYLNGGAASVNAAVGLWVADMGVRSNLAQANYSTQSAVYSDSLNVQQSVSGVNLDEEAANLIRYQQAYAAMSKVISTSNEMFKTLMQAFN